MNRRDFIACYVGAVFRQIYVRAKFKISLSTINIDIAGKEDRHTEFLNCHFFGNKGQILDYRQQETVKLSLPKKKSTNLRLFKLNFSRV